MKKLWMILGGVFGFIALGVGLYFLEESYTDVILHGANPIETTVKEEYTDPGLDLFHNDKMIEKDKYTVDFKSDVDTNTLGKYKVTYDVKYHLRKFHLEREVNVVDNVKPVITANLEKLERDYCTKKDKKEFTYTAEDNYDGDLSEKIEKNEEEDNVILTVTDNSGNTGTLTVPIDYGEKPKNVLKLSGNSTTYVVLNGTYKEQGAAYYDGCGKKLEDKVSTSGSVDTKKTGTYTITYSVADGTKATRKVVVYKESDPVISGSGNGKVLYLTFDDGPGPYTQQILNTLAKYNVKATFFVTNQFPKYVYLIKNERDAGHTVAVHTYTHASNWSMYKSVDAYLDDFNKMNAVIEKYTGSKTRLFRFPGGSSNTVSRRWGKGIVRQIANKMTSLGYIYFDWDVGSGDTDGNGSRSKIYSNVVNGAARCKSCVILMHDIKPNTANELDHILSTLVAKGYRFGALTTSSPTAHHSIAN